MKRIYIFAIALLVASIAGENAYAQHATAEEAARAILGELPDGGAAGLNTLGLSSAGEAKKGGLDVPFNVYMVGLDDLRSYDVSQEESALLRDLEQVVYPVTADGKARLSLGVHKTRSGWETREISSPELVSLLLKARASAMAAENRSANAYFIVRIPALKMVFVASQGVNGLTLRSALDIPEIGLAANTAISGSELFEALRPVAQAYVELTP